MAAAFLWAKELYTCRKNSVIGHLDLIPRLITGVQWIEDQGKGAELLMTHRIWAEADWELFALACADWIKVQPFLLKRDPDDEEFRALKIRKRELMSALAEAIELRTAQKLHQEKQAEETEAAAAVKVAEKEAAAAKTAEEAAAVKVAEEEAAVNPEEEAVAAKAVENATVAIEASSTQAKEGNVPEFTEEQVADEALTQQEGQVMQV